MPSACGLPGAEIAWRAHRAAHPPLPSMAVATWPAPALARRPAGGIPRLGHPIDVALLEAAHHGALAWLEERAR
jgi:hypothetical protein